MPTFTVCRNQKKKIFSIQKITPVSVVTVVVKEQYFQQKCSGATNSRKCKYSNEVSWNHTAQHLCKYTYYIFEPNGFEFENVLKYFYNTYIYKKVKCILTECVTLNLGLSAGQHDTVQESEGKKRGKWNNQRKVRVKESCRAFTLPAKLYGEFFFTVL